MQNATQFIQQRRDEVLQKIVPGVQAFGEKQGALKEEYRQFIAKHSVEALGCDAQCIEQCT